MSFDDVCSYSHLAYPPSSPPFSEDRVEAMHEKEFLPWNQFFQMNPAMDSLPFPSMETT